MQPMKRLPLIVLTIAACCSVNAARAGSRTTITRAVSQNCLTIDGNTGRCIKDGRMPPPPLGVHVGTTSDPNPDAPAKTWATRGIPQNCLTIDGNTGRCITDGRMPPPPPGVHVGTTSDPGPDCQKTDQNGNCVEPDHGPTPGVTSLGTGHNR